MVKVNLKSNLKNKTLEVKSLDGSDLFPHRNKFTLTGLSFEGFFYAMLLLFVFMSGCQKEAFAEVDTTGP